MVTLVGIIGKSKATISEALSLNRLPQAIRDECRQDPTVPKNVLVEIARKKQERSMLTKFKQYREKQAKAAAKDDAGAPAHRHSGSGPRRRPSPRASAPRRARSTTSTFPPSPRRTGPCSSRP